MMSERIAGHTNPGRATVEDIGVDHRCLYLPVPHEFLYRSNVVCAFEQVGRKGMAECVAADVLGDTGLADGYFHGGLKGHLGGMEDFRFLADGMRKREGARCRCGR